MASSQATPGADGVIRKDFIDGVKLNPLSSEIEGQTLAAGAALHAMAFSKKKHSFGEEVPIEEEYDFVVAGAGLSGLSAAHFYQQRFPSSKVLIIDPLLEFGGHAQRNEFVLTGEQGGVILGYGGSESLQSPKANFSGHVNDLLKTLKVDLSSFETKYFQHKLYPDLGLSRASFFDGEKFTGAGRGDTLVNGDPTAWVSDDVAPDSLNAKPLLEFINDFPLSQEARKQLSDLYTNKEKVTLSHLASHDAKIEYLAKISYQTFLLKDWGLSEEASSYFQNRTLDFFGLPPNMTPALEAGHYGYPGLQGIDLPKNEEAEGELSEPYIYHFPDGNASIARLLVRSLIPSAATGNTAEDIIFSKFDRAQFDLPQNSVRLRLGASVVYARNTSDGKAVEIGYLVGDVAHKIKAKHTTLACFNMAIPYIVDGDSLFSSEQAESLKSNVKAPLVYINVAVRNWQPWVKLGVHEIYGVGSFFSRVKLDYPVVIGDYKSGLDPNQPVLLHLVHVPAVADASDPRAALRLARKTLFGKKFEEFEKTIRTELNKMLGPGGFDDQRDILGIIVNRWSHGYSYNLNTLMESESEGEHKIKIGCKPIGNITIASSDASWSAYAHSAIDEAYRAVEELKI